MTKTTDTAMPALLLGEAGSDPIEDRLRETVRATIEAL
jgi:putative transposase